jgi:3-deoxy-D-manno-octulosonate 8-phosphate phosphatase (KDO 8-P phosphatase)
MDPTKIKLLALDVDGVMTDGSVTYSSNGSEYKTFNIKDGVGIKRIQAAGIQVAIITGRESVMVSRRAAELGISLIIQGREDKGAALSELSASLSLSADECAYMGDDIPDLSAIAFASISACPADAVTEVKAASTVVMEAAGGRGCVREFCDFLLDAQSI